MEEKKLTLALIAHDNKKEEMISWAKKHQERLRNYNLCGTGTTARLVKEAISQEVHPYLSGPLGGDLEIGAKVAEGKINAVIFFWDPLSAQPHDPDVKALMRIVAVYDVPFATNKATANLILGINSLSE